MAHRAPAVLLLAALAACHSAPSPDAAPGAMGFDEGSTEGWRTQSSGDGGPTARWLVQRDASAVSAPNVLAVVDANRPTDGRFNLYWSEALRFGDGRLGVSVRADTGEIDQGGGPMWRVQDERNYYICRINPLEANYRVYVVKDGVRRQLATALCDVKPGTWYRLEVRHEGDTIACWLDGKLLLEAKDATIPQAGGVGLWTKADARTSFDDLRVEAD